MNGKDLFEGMSYVDERYIEEAESRAYPRTHWIKAAALAACLCLILFSLYSRDDPIPSEGSAAQDEVNIPAGVESYGCLGDPENSPTEEVPSVILYVQEPTEFGWIGTVCELVDTDIFEIGMELNVVLADQVRNETAGGSSLVVEDKKADYSGRYVMVQFIEYDRETGTIVVNLIREVQPPETTPQKG